MERRELKPDFCRMLERLPQLDGLAEALAETAAETSVRLHPLKGDGLFADTDKVGWCPSGRYLPSRPDFTRDPAMHQGRYYVQEASSMFIAHVLRQLTAGMSPLAMLDACAAPGGKTTAALDVLPEGSMVVANELAGSRAAALRENIIKWGNENSIVTHGDASRFSRLKDTFDIIAVDAPCSGEGMMRKEPKAVEQWSPALVDECAARQRSIVESLWMALRPGGYMIYSTCTFNTLENEEIVDFLGAESVAIDIDPAWNITGALTSTRATCYRFIPGKTRGEGLFMSVMRKPGDSHHDYPSTAKASRPHSLSRRLTDADSLVFTESPTGVSAFPARWMWLLKEVEKTTEVIHYGVTVGEKAGRDYAPTQSLAMSRRLDKSVFPTLEVDTATALDYLRRQAVTLPAGLPKGYILLTHGSYPLGFVKNIGNRANNLYPKEWRILSTH